MFGLVEPNFPRNFVVSQHFGQELMETVRDKRTTVKQDPKLVSKNQYVCLVLLVDVDI